MVQRIFKAVWGLSLLATLGVFLYVYASFPVEVMIKNQGELVVFSRDATFYVFIGMMAAVNSFVFLVSKFYTKINVDFTSWFYGLVTVINFFLMTSIGYLYVINSGESYDYSNLGTLLTISVGMVGVWILSWPVYRVTRKS